MASGTIIAGFFIRACMGGLLRDELPRSGHIDRDSFVINVTDKTQEIVTVSETNSRARTIGYWVVTALVALTIGSGGAAQLAHMPANVEGMVHLGYPAYLLTILGAWKVAGTLAVLAPRLPRLKEWAYAGIVFDLTGAVASHAACGAVLWHILAPAILAVLACASWALRPASRVVGTLFGTKGGQP